MQDFERRVGEVEGGEKDCGLSLHAQHQLQVRTNANWITADFYLPAHGVYIEYWGLADSSDQYRKRMYVKMARYKKHGVNIVSLYPSDMNNSI